MSNHFTYQDYCGPTINDFHESESESESEEPTCDMCGDFGIVSWFDDNESDIVVRDFRSYKMMYNFTVPPEEHMFCMCSSCFDPQVQEEVTQYISCLMCNRDYIWFYNCYGHECTTTFIQTVDHCQLKAGYGSSYDGESFEVTNPGHVELLSAGHNADGSVCDDCIDSYFRT